MIFVTVGSQKFQMNRLLEEVDRLIETGILSEAVFAQSGYCTYEPRHFLAERFVDQERMRELLEQASFVICHAGSSSINTALGLKKKTIIVPRRSDCGEHVDDHQFELSSAMKSAGCALEVRDIRELGATIAGLDAFEPKPHTSCTHVYVEHLHELFGIAKGG